MKRVVNFLIAGMILLSLSAVAQSPAQVNQNGQRPRPADDRMSRDIAVAENVLGTLIKQEFEQRNFFFMDIKGNYISGYGVTFTVPTSMLNASVWSAGGNELVVTDGNLSGYTYATDAAAVYERDVARRETEEAKKAMRNATKEEQKAQKERDKAEQNRQAASDRDHELQERQVYGIGTAGSGVQTITTRGRSKYYNADSVNTVNNAKVINAAKNFIADYGDMLSQLTPEERVVVTNRSGGEHQFWYSGQAKRSLLSVEATKGDLTQYRQGKLTREQLIAKIKVVNSVSSNKTEPDMELLSSIFNRLYQSDLSTTYYVQNNVYYERLTDFGAILHMQVVSSITNTDMYGNYKTGTDVRLTMPTQRLNNLTQAERDKKVKELYPVFESELKENILEYGRTLRSLNDNEQLMVDVSVTKCEGCGIPGTLELVVKASVLKDFNAGKLDKSAALSKIEVKKGAAQ